MPETIRSACSTTIFNRHLKTSMFKFDFERYNTPVFLIVTGVMLICLITLLIDPRPYTPKPTYGQ